MKKIATTLSVTLAALSAVAGNYTITVNFADASLNGQKAYITNYDTGIDVDSTVVKGKRAIFRGTVDNSYFARISAGGRKCGLVVEDGNIVVDWQNGIATGTALNVKLNKWDEATKNIETEEQYAAACHHLYEENRDNGIGPWAFYNYIMEKDFALEQLDSAMATVPTSYKSMTRFKKAIDNAKAANATAEGKMFTDFTVKGEDGKDYKLSDYVGKGSYTLVDFWASWCGPCRREIPKIKQYYNQYNGKGMNFLGVAVWDKPADTHKAVAAMQIPWPVIIGTHKLTEPTDIYGINGIPHIIIFDPQGKVVSRGLQGEALKAKVEELMK